VLQLRQGFGRLIRGHADRGVVAILDPRLRSRRYGRAFLDALPRCPLVEERSAVASFFGERVAASA
jgi:ATP-dependent DNA helicase DinG